VFQDYEARLQDVMASPRSMYRRQQEPMRFVRVGADGGHGHVADDVRHEIVFRATDQPVSCYCIRLTPAGAPGVQKTQCEVFDRNGEAVGFDLVPAGDGTAGEREYLLFFRELIVPGDAGASGGGALARHGLKHRLPGAPSRCADLTNMWSC
jgi:hypothetical protein